MGVTFVLYFQAVEARFPQAITRDEAEEDILGRRLWNISAFGFPLVDACSCSLFSAICEQHRQLGTFLVLENLRTGYLRVIR